MIMDPFRHIGNAIPSVSLPFRHRCGGSRDRGVDGGVPSSTGSTMLAVPMVYPKLSRVAALV